MSLPASTTTGVVLNIQKFSLHDGPGIRTVVFLKGCPLRCDWCSNPESLDPRIEQVSDPATGEPRIEGRLATVAEVIETCEQDRPFYKESGGGVTLSGGEALMQHAFATTLLAQLRQRGIHTAMETTGHVARPVFDKALDVLDHLLIDVKHHDRAEHRRRTGRSNDLPLRNLARAVERDIAMTVRIPVVPGVNDGLADAGAFAALLRRLGVPRVQLLPFHQLGERKYELLGRAYPMAGASALYPEDLVDYRQVFEREGVRATCCRPGGGPGDY